MFTLGFIAKNLESPDKIYVYTVSGAGTTIANGDYYESDTNTYTNGICTIRVNTSNDGLELFTGTNTVLYYKSGSTNPADGTWEIANGSGPGPTVTNYIVLSDVLTNPEQYVVKITLLGEDPNNYSGTYDGNEHTGESLAWFRTDSPDPYFIHDPNETSWITYKHTWSFNQSGEPLWYCDDEDPCTGTWIKLYGSTDLTTGITVEFIKK